MRRNYAFTLIELLIVVTIISILAAIALFNFRFATERSLMASNASNLHTIATALQIYMTDYGHLPPADREAGPFKSHTRDFSTPGNGPAAGGSWDGLPWLLYEHGYISNWRTMFNPKYLRLYKGGETIRGGWPRYHNFRYAYNSSALSTGGHSGGMGNVESGTVWIVRDLFLPPEWGFYAGNMPSYPADYDFPWENEEGERELEQAIYSDFAVRLVVGGSDKRAE
jgi:prepilin-type N-terminal cleavage/methylation domain-containing protein